MLLPKFAFHQPAGVAEALEIMARYGEQAAIIAGGTDLLVNMKHGKLAPTQLIGLERLEELAGLGANGDALVVGPRLTASALAASGELSGAAQVLALGAGAVGSPQVRNRATVGGNLCTARPAADMCLPLLALGAKALLAGPGGPRELPLAEFFKGPGQTAKEPGELLTGISFAKPGEGSGAGYEKLGLRKALEIALVNVAATLWLEPDGKTVQAAKVALGAVAPTPMLSPGAEAALVGAAAGEEAFAQAAKAAAADAKPISDHRGSADYRREVVEVLTRRALKQAWQAALGR